MLMEVYDATNGGGWRRRRGWGEADLSAFEGVDLAPDRTPRLVHLGANDLCGELPDDAVRAMVRAFDTTFYLDGNAALQQRELDAPEARALVALYNSTNGPAWSACTDGWLSARPASQWPGVTVVDGHVHVLWLSNCNLAGPLVDMSALQQVRKIYLQRNAICDSLNLAHLHGCPELETLRVSYNRLSGQFASWRPPRSLRELDLHHNYLRGGPPASLFELPHLETCLLHRNKLSAHLPSTILGNQSLRRLTLFEQQVSYSKQVRAWRSLGFLCDVDIGL